MITCTFNGRLGNNLFQIATTIGLAKKNNYDFAIPKTTWAGHRGYLDVDLSMFQYTFNRKENDELNLPDSYNDPEFHYTPINIQDNTRLSGFYQSWKYFDDIREDLLNVYFHPSDQVKTQLSKYNISSDSLGISIRRGDYLMLQNNHCVLSVEYYQNVIDKYFQNNIDSIYIFSDDIEWCRTIFGNDVNYVTDSIGVQLFLMTEMKHLILSNSTFAWWGAYLNRNNGIIIAPDPWFGPSYADKNTMDLYYPSWIKFDHQIVTQPFIQSQNMFI